MRSAFDNLPTGWHRARLDRVASVRARIGWKALTAAEYAADGIAFLSTPNIKAAEIDFKDVNFIPKWRYEESPELKLQVGDVLLAKDGNTLGITNLVRTLPRPATVNGSIAVVRPSAIDPRFLRYVLDSTATQGRIDALKAGMGVPHLFQWDINRLPIPMPPSREQRAIADFLDTETTRIDAVTSKKRRMIALLAERISVLRTAAFQNLGRWRLKRVLRAPMAYGVLVPRFVDPDAGVAMTRIGALNLDGTVAAERLAYIDPLQSLEYRRTKTAAGDLLVSVVGSMGRSAVVDSSIEGANTNRPLARLQPVRHLPARLLWHWTQTELFMDQARLATSSDTAQPTLNLGDLAEFDTGLPSDPDTWVPTLERLEAQLAPHDSAMSALRSQIALLQEHRQAMITAAVTGQLEMPVATA